MKACFKSNDPSRARDEAVVARRQRGSIYVAILGLSLLAAAISIGGIAVTRIQSRNNDLRNDIQEARAYAQTAIELGRTWIALDPTWRNDYTNGNWITNQSFGNGSFTLNVVNPNGALNNADTDPITLTATGTKGIAVQQIQVTLNPVLVPVTSLNTAITAGSINFQTSTIVGGGSIAASLSTVTATNAAVYPKVIAAGLVTGGSFNSGSTQNTAAPTMPDSRVFDYYIAKGTAINYASIPTSGANHMIDQSLLSPAHNPFTGTTNANGIYVIDCQNNNFVIQNSRIVGTIVLLNPGPNSSIRNSVNWQPAVTNYPCLLVKGNIAITCANTSLNESTTNFNPSGTPYPYPGGATNATTTDSYPSLINGFIYVSGNLTTATSPTFDSIITGGTLITTNTLTLTFNSLFYGSPPPGFYSIQMKPATSSWMQVVH